MVKLSIIWMLLLTDIVCGTQAISMLYPAASEQKQCFSDEGAANYAKALKIIEEKGEGMTGADWDYVYNLGYEETKDGYYELIGGGCSWYCGDGGPIKITASSRLANQGSNNYNEENLHDFEANTSWVEGVKGYGIGEWVEYTFRAKNPRITEILIVNGYGKSQSAWKNNSRVKKLKLYIKGKPVAILNLEDTRCVQSFEIAPVTDDKEWTMKFEIMDVYKGDKWEDTAISEIYFSGLDVH